jgi:phosphoribosylformimino-5-aminoimidazole carboxamide ribotide isomerase
MLILPAIDLRGGQCVRLRQGDFAQETVFSTDPAAMAQRWVRDGATYLHLVDLDGAKLGHPANGESVCRIVEAAGVPCQFGGGVRTAEDLAQVFGWGVSRAVVGTKALKDPVWFKEICQRFPGKIVLGIDARDGRVATDGWLEVSNCSALTLARQYESWPLAALVYTDIGRDGMMEGPNFEALAELAAEVHLPIIASGGVSTLEDVRRLAGLCLAGCIVGRALYQGSLNLAAAIAAAAT